MVFKYFLVLSFIIGATIKVTGENFYSKSKEEKLQQEMMAFFEKTLEQNFGELTDTSLYQKFIDVYRKYNGEFYLRTNQKKLDKINRKLFLDENYYYFFNEVIFVDSLDHSEISSSDPHSVYRLVTFDRKPRMKGALRRLGQYSVCLNLYYLELIKSKTEGNKLVMDYLSNIHITSDVSFVHFFMCMEKNIDCMNRELSKKLVSVIFWKYLCEINNIDFHKRRLKTD